MGVRVLVGDADGTKAAALYDSVTGWMIGPIFEAEDAYEQAEAFLDWMRHEPYLLHAEEIELTPLDIPDPRYIRADDPRVWPDSGLAKLVAYWRRDHVADGLLIPPPDDEEPPAGDPRPDPGEHPEFWRE
jgi:hypothetical protein